MLIYNEFNNHVLAGLDVLSCSCRVYSLFNRVNRVLSVDSCLLKEDACPLL